MVGNSLCRVPFITRGGFGIPRWRRSIPRHRRARLPADPLLEVLQAGHPLQRGGPSHLHTGCGPTGHVGGRSGGAHLREARVDSVVIIVGRRLEEVCRVVLDGDGGVTRRGIWWATGEGHAHRWHVGHSRVQRANAGYSLHRVLRHFHLNIRMLVCHKVF